LVTFTFEVLGAATPPALHLRTVLTHRVAALPAKAFARRAFSLGLAFAFRASGEEGLCDLVIGHLGKELSLALALALTCSFPSHEPAQSSNWPLHDLAPPPLGLLVCPVHMCDETVFVEAWGYIRYVVVGVAK
jgi:hypothetical protein